MKHHPIDLLIIVVYLAAVAAIGIAVKKRATKKLDSYYLGDRNVPWWMLGLSGSKDFTIIKINDEFTDRHYCDIFKLVTLRAAIDSNHPINRYPIVFSEASHRIFP
jgi:hypothetical protein